MRIIRLLVLALLPLPLLAAEYTTEVVAEGFNHPWSVTFLPDGGYLLATRAGEIYPISASGDTGEPILNTPDTYVAGQGGYFDIVLDPDYANNQLVYLSYAGGTPAANGTTVTRARLANNRFNEPEVIFSAEPKKDTPQHYGGKLLFLEDGSLMLTTGDGFEYREAAQDTFNHMGKSIRIQSDGSVPADNPFVSNKKGDAKVFTYGHRNPQGLVQDPVTNTIYLHEHGPKGGDEVNVLVAGENYGWPAVTYGDNYSGAYVSPLKEHPRVKAPLHYWVPSIAPSGMAVYRGAAFSAWDGDLLVGALVDKEVRRLDIEDGKVVAEEPLFGELGLRIRDVRVSPAGNIYLVTDSASGKLIRVTP